MRDRTIKCHFESVERVITAMKARLGQPLTLEAMAKIACFSSYYFNRMFRQVTGVPPSQFLYALRLDRARRLLMHTDLKVADICRDVGYHSIGTFTRRFTGLIGVSPTSLRELSQSVPDLHPIPVNGGFGKQKCGARCTLAGHVSAPAGFQGMTFVGLFESAVPQSRPAACAIANADGFYKIHDVPDGEFYLFGLGLRYPISPPDSFDYESALRGGHTVRILQKSVLGSRDLRLRPPLPFDPPILLALPALISKHLAGQPGIENAGSEGVDCHNRRFVRGGP